MRKLTIIENIQTADSLKLKRYEDSLLYLEEAHLEAQKSFLLHLSIHWKILSLAFHHEEWREVFGQILRLIFVIPNSVLGISPVGNLGSTKMGIFEKNCRSANEEE